MLFPPLKTKEMQMKYRQFHVPISVTVNMQQVRRVQEKEWKNGTLPTTGFPYQLCSVSPRITMWPWKLLWNVKKKCNWEVNYNNATFCCFPFLNSWHSPDSQQWKRFFLYWIQQRNYTLPSTLYSISNINPNYV